MTVCCSRVSSITGELGWPRATDLGLVPPFVVCDDDLLGPRLSAFGITAATGA